MRDEALTDLLARVEAAEGPDRELDRDIAVWEYPTLADLPRAYHGGWGHPEYGVVAPPSAYTASLDAALGLCERVLPGRAGDLIREALAAVGRKHALHMRFWKPAEDGSYVQALALALLAAMLTALVAQAAGPEGAQT